MLMQYQSNTSSSSTTVTSVTVTYPKRPRKGIERFAGWYMGRIAGRYCPCQWPLRIKPLIRLCGRIDDIECRYQKHSELSRCMAFYHDLHRGR